MGWGEGRNQRIYSHVNNNNIAHDTPFSVNIELHIPFISMSLNKMDKEIYKWEWVGLT